MAPSFAHTKMRRAEKAGPEQCPWPFSRRFFDQTPRRRRHERPPHLHRDHAGAAARDPGKVFIADAGYDSNRFRQAIRDKEEARRHRLQTRATAQAADVARAVQQALSRRVLLPQLEALPRHRHALREDGAELPGTHPSRMRVAMACAKLGTTPLVRAKPERKSPAQPRGPLKLLEAVRIRTVSRDERRAPRPLRATAYDTPASPISA